MPFRRVCHTGRLSTGFKKCPPIFTLGQVLRSRWPSCFPPGTWDRRRSSPSAHTGTINDDQVKKRLRNCGKQVSGRHLGEFKSKTCEPPEPAQQLGEQLIGAPEKPVPFPTRVFALIVVCIRDPWSHTC